MTKANRTPDTVLVRFVKESGTDGNVGLFVRRRGHRAMREALFQHTKTGSGREYRLRVEEVFETLKAHVYNSLAGNTSSGKRIFIPYRRGETEDTTNS